MNEVKSIRERILQLTRQPAPATHVAPELSQDGVEALFFDGPAWKGKPTRVFAFIGIPPSATAEHPVPGIVLVHGGGGTAFAEWVRLWTGRGYAAIAMDLNGHVPVGQYSQWEVHGHAGPSGMAGKNSDPDFPAPWSNAEKGMEEQWPYHAISAIVGGHSLLAGDPRVDPGRMGITGISWGGWLTATMVGLDPRYKAAAPVYGCAWPQFMTVEKGIEPWMEMWDPSVHLQNARCPILWVNGTNDFAFWPPTWFASGRLNPSESLRSMTHEMEHAHGGPGENPLEIHAFMEEKLRGGPKMTRILGQRVVDDAIVVDYREDPAYPVISAELLYTRSDDLNWPKRLWERRAANVDKAANAASVGIVNGARAGFVNLIDSRGVTMSSELFEWEV